MPRRFAWLALTLLLLASPTAWGQRLLIGAWQWRLDQSTATLTIITADNDGALHGTMYYDPPLEGFAGSPFTIKIENGAFTIRLVNGTRYQDMHWCRDALCGTFYMPDDTATPVLFERPAQ